MTAGIVTVTDDFTFDDTSGMKSALEALYAGTNDKWVPVKEGGRVRFVHVNGG